MRIFTPGDERDLIFGKVSDALELLAERDPRRFFYLRRDLSKISIVPLPIAIGSCFYPLGMCAVDFDYVASAKTTPAHLAQTLVHEGAHARLRRAGFGYGESERSRIERICFLQEAAFARKIPGATALVLEAESNLEYPEGFFSSHARRQRELEALRELGWLGRVGFRIVKLLSGTRRE